MTLGTSEGGAVQHARLRAVLCLRLRGLVAPGPAAEAAALVPARCELFLLRPLGLSFLAPDLGLVDRGLAARACHRSRARQSQPEALAGAHRGDEPRRLGRVQVLEL